MKYSRVASSQPLPFVRMPRPTPKIPLVPLQIRLTKAKSDQLDILSLKLYRSKASIIAEAVDDYFEKLNNQIL